MLSPVLADYGVMHILFIDAMVTPPATPGTSSAADLKVKEMKAYIMFQRIKHDYIALASLLNEPPCQECNKDTFVLLTK